MDLTPFFADDVFAIAAVLAGTAVRGIFDGAYVSAGAGLGMACSVPAFTLPTASVPAEVVGSTLAIDAVSYFVAEHQPDGTGVSILLLELSA